MSSRHRILEAPLAGRAATPITGACPSDVQLAALFSGRALPPGEDEIVVAAIEGILQAIGFIVR